MHSVEELGTNVPAFLAKLWKIVEDDDTNDLICWSPGGTSFYIRNQARFSRELLPLYYKHNNMASFIRQLNMYGFHKVVSIEGGGLKVDNDEMEFAHQFFLRAHPYLLEHIKRKVPCCFLHPRFGPKMNECMACIHPHLMFTIDIPTNKVDEVLADVKSMKGRQDSLDSQLSAMKRENEVLWREVAILRQKHKKQQQIVNKLIQFLVTMVQSSRNGGIGIKRHYPLMLNDTSHNGSKVSKLSAELSDQNSSHNMRSPAGPVIHELDASDLLEDCKANPEENESGGSFSPSDLCNVVIVGDEENQNPSSDATQQTGGNPDPTTSIENPEILLELSEDCPLSPSLLLTASPIDVSPAIVTPRLSNGKNRARGGAGDVRKRRTRRTNSNNKVLGSSAFAPKVSVGMSSVQSDKVPLIKGVEILNAVLPTLADEKPSELGEETNNEITDVQIVEDLLSDPVAAATNAAVSAISNVAASKRKNSQISHGDKSLANGVSSQISNAGIANDTKVNNIDAMVFEPSTSDDKSTDASNMLLAYTGNTNCDNKIFGRDDFDNHVDSLQNDLESLRDLLKGESYSLDANTLLGVCATIPAFSQDFLKLFSEDTLTDIPETEFDTLSQEREKNSEETQLATYSSNLLDMVDMFGSPGENDWNSSNPETSSIMDISLSELNTPQMTIASPNAVSKNKV